MGIPSVGRRPFAVHHFKTSRTLGSNIMEWASRRLKMLQTRLRGKVMLAVHGNSVGKEVVLSNSIVFNLKSRVIRLTKSSDTLW